MSHWRIYIQAAVVAVTVGGDFRAVLGQTPVKVAPKEDPAERAFANGYKKIFPKFFTTMKKIISQPDPDFPPGSTKPQKRDIVARQDDAIVAAAATAHKEMSALKPTPNLRALHQASLHLLAEYRDTYTANAAAYRDGDRKKAEAAWKAIKARTDAAVRRLQKASDNLRERDGSLPVRRKPRTR
ncbi:MAG: hypothetical protein H8F28_07965 [Fibrella sp.]|nr:hypothetical protein [Armatimonadota bacterium]